MKQKQKFMLSQKAHRRLFEKYDNYKSNVSRKKCNVLANYHFKVFSDQSIQGRLLSKSERRKIYSNFCK